MRQAGDPFGEQRVRRLRARLHVLGGEFAVESSDPALLKLAVDAFGGLAAHRLGPAARRFRVELVVTDHRARPARSVEPPRATLSAGVGLLCATVDAGNFAIVDAAMSRALVCVSRRMLERRYYARYELIELAFVTLASRAQSLVPLHAACVGVAGAGALLMGPSGAGKSTLSVHALHAGMQLLSEDSAFVETDTLRVTGVANYLHLQPSALGFLSDGPLLRRIRRSPVIRRRSGTRKLEVNLRDLPGGIAAAPPRLAATVFLSKRQAGRGAALKRIGRTALLARLRREQPYAAGLSGWRRFEQRVAAVPAYDLARTAHPDIAIRELHSLLAGVRQTE